MKTILSLCILIFTVVCRAATPQDILNSAAAYQAFSDRDLKIANVYMLAQLSGTSASSVASNSAPYQALSERQLLEAQTWLLSQVSGGGATNLTPWTSDINGAAHSLTNVASVTNTGNIQTATLNATTSITVGGTGGATFNGGFTTVGQTNSNWTYGFASVNDSSGRMTNTFNGSGLTNLPIVTSVTIPMGAFFTNSSIDGASLTAASAVPGTNGDTFTFADVVTNRILCRLALPWDWNGGTVQAELWCYSTGTNSLQAGDTNSVWGVRAVAVATGGSVGSITWGTQIVVTNGCSWGTYTNTACITRAITVGNTPTGAKDILWDIQRLGAFTGDTMTNATGVSLAAVRIFYQQNTRSDFPTASP